MAFVAAVQPTGAERVVLPDEVFFSTTDRRGIIRSGNSVFSRIACYSQQELIGAPHNIIRHPDMPAGVFRIMWDRLLVGLPVAAYVVNLAKDGSTYWVFATITPVGDGFLSVRTAPSCGPLFHTVRTLYTSILKEERELAHRQGLNRAEVAQTSAALIGQRLADLGFNSFDEFLQEALPAEVAAREELSRTSFVRPGAIGPAAEILAGASALDRHLHELVSRLASYGRLASALGDSAATVLRIARGLSGSAAAAQAASAAVAVQAPVLRNVSTVMAQPMADAVAALETLSPRLEQLRSDVAALRQRIALAQLHTDMVAIFAGECVDGEAPARALADIPLLCDTLYEDIEDVAVASEAVNQDLVDVGQQVETARALVDDFRKFLGQWRILVMRHRVGGVLQEYVGPIDDQLAAVWDQLQELSGLGTRCRGSVVTVDTAAIGTRLGIIRDAARQVA